jgi:hypothetical protein
MNPNEVLTPELVKALGNYIPTPQRQQPRATPSVSRREGNASLQRATPSNYAALKINKQ